MKHPISLKLGRKIAELRKLHGLSQEELGFRSNLHRTYIGAIERGEKSISVIAAIQIAVGLNEPITKIITDDLTLSEQ